MNNNFVGRLTELQGENERLKGVILGKEEDNEEIIQRLGFEKSNSIYKTSVLCPAS